ncbi:M48 family metallopeptidase [Streptomyces sp. NPDC048643]|uniref:M48 family metallopeptidase n=1 Tax=Streptomyces sp. NPDC048643 TaxID=3155637 RepID=UPI00343090B2
MTASLRAVRALALLVGFYLMGAVLLALVGIADWLVFSLPWVTRSPYLVVTAVATSAALVVPILLGMFAFLLAGGRSAEEAGRPVTPHEQPELWAEVLEAARAAGTRPPEEVLLTEDLNAAVAERARLLGLLSGRRRLYLGVPLLAGLTVPRLRAVLAHEFGHFSNQDTQLAVVTMRGRAAVLHTVKAFRHAENGASVLVGRLYVRYAQLFLKVSQSTGRRQELAADQAAARRAGRDTTAAALRRMAVLDAAFDHYIDTYALMGDPVSALPPVGEFFGGFARMLAARDPQALAELAAARRTPRPSPYDSHPPITERVALIEALPDDGVAEDPAAPPASSLLRDQGRLSAELEESALSADARTMRRLDWPDLAMARAEADAIGWARPLLTAVRRSLHAAATREPGTTTPHGPAADDRAPEPGTTSPATAAPDPAPRPEAGEPGLEDVLNALDDGLLWMEIADRMPKPAQASRLTGRSARNFIRPALWDALAGLLHLHLIAQGAAHPDTGWSSRPGLALPDAWETGFDAALDAALADTPDTTPLRTLLALTPVPPKQPQPV